MRAINVYYYYYYSDAKNTFFFYSILEKGFSHTPSVELFLSQAHLYMHLFQFQFFNFPFCDLFLMIFEESGKRQKKTSKQTNKQTTTTLVSFEFFICILSVPDQEHTYWVHIIKFRDSCEKNCASIISKCSNNQFLRICFLKSTVYRKSLKQRKLF